MSSGLPLNNIDERPGIERVSIIILPKMSKYTMIIKENMGQIWCFGKNNHFQLGTGLQGQSY